MKKILILLSITVLLTGCSVVRIDTSDIDNIVNVVLSKDNDLYNRIGKGYKYYVPRQANYIDTIEYNDKIYSNGNYYYLYVDVISYYYEKEVEHVIDDDAYYSRELEFDGKFGYIEITEVENRYLIEFVYNYAVMQTLVEEESINDAILDASYILSTIKYNRDVIALNIDNDLFDNKEENYDVFESKKIDSFLLQGEDEEESNEEDYEIDEDTETEVEEDNEEEANE